MTQAPAQPQAPKPLSAYTDDEIRKAAFAQVRYKCPDDLASKPLDVQQAWVRDAERRLWGASIVMSERLGYKPRLVVHMRKEGDELELAWLALYDAISAVKNAWTFDVAWAWIEERMARRRQVHDEVMVKLGRPVAQSDAHAAAALAPTP